MGVKPILADKVTFVTSEFTVRTVCADAAQPSMTNTAIVLTYLRFTAVFPVLVSVHFLRNIWALSAEQIRIGPWVIPVGCKKNGIILVTGA